MTIRAISVLDIPRIDRMANVDFKQSYSNCELCPRKCGVDRTAGKLGICGASSVMQISRIGLHEWEEPPICGKSGSGAVFFSGCSLGCAYCQNAKISRKCIGRAYTPDELAHACVDLQKQCAANINMVSPTHFSLSIVESIKAARNLGLTIPVIWNTSGYERVDTIDALEGSVDIYLTDMKYSSSDLAFDMSQAADYPDIALKALYAMVEQTGPVHFDVNGTGNEMRSGVIVRHMVIPGHVDDSKAVITRVHEMFGNDVRLSIMSQYTPVIVEAKDLHSVACLKKYPELSRKLTNREYEDVLDFADSIGVQDYFWQQGEAASESFIPEFNLQM